MFKSAKSECGSELSYTFDDFILDTNATRSEVNHRSSWTTKDERSEIARLSVSGAPSRCPGSLPEVSSSGWSTSSLVGWFVRQWNSFSVIETTRIPSLFGRESVKHIIDFHLESTFFRCSLDWLDPPCVHR